MNPQKFYINPDTYYAADSEARLAIAEETLATLKKQRQWLTKREHELPALAVVDEFAETWPKLVDAWRNRYSFVFSEAEAVRNRCGGDRPGWNDYHMFRWLLNHKLFHVTAMLSRIYHPIVDVGGTCLWMMRSECLRHPDLLSQINKAIDAEPSAPELMHCINDLRLAKITLFGQEIIQRVRQAQAETKAAKN